MEEGKDYFKAEKREDIPPEWQKKLDDGDAVELAIVQPRMSGTHLAVVLALMFGGLLCLPVLQAGFWYNVTLGGVVGVGCGYAFLYYKAQQLIAMLYNQLQVERAGASAIFNKIISTVQDLEDGTSEDETCLNKDDASSEPEQTND